MKIYSLTAVIEEAFRAHPTARERFDALSFTHRREHAAYVAEAKKEETRRRRAGKTIQALMR